MTHTSPATSALWLFCYLVTHLWKFDRFACIKYVVLSTWNIGDVC
ncbi:hypothetical protein AG1IA_03800 [Rhizoctonia solani AG-1 IA]|uniref:Uncharacterized protein n=1 Tax=Thanatephorus cucumeris (strain AG1-IA) TaxID=983506 RepID=L8WZC7_THACA|nr:hypothetical protein AG1IA_03800 [Rhizoctonia solani AG-1 IA]